MTDPVKVRGFMCATDFYHELDGDAYGTSVYCDEATLRRNRKCVDECGIVEVEVTLVRVVKEGSLP